MSSSQVSKLALLVLWGSIALLTACEQLKETANSFTADAGKASFERSSTTYEDDECTSENCATVTIRSVAVTDNHRVNQIINAEIEETISAFIRSTSAKGIDAITQAFFSDYREFKESFPESNTPWEITVHVTGDWINTSKGYISIKIDTYSYTGGAHTNQEIKYLNLSLDGRKLKEIDWLQDREALLVKAEDAFRKQKKIDPMGSLNDAGYEFENNRFQLPESMGFADGKLILYYNSYEISSYAEGPTEIKIPVSELKGILRE